MTAPPRRTAPAPALAALAVAVALALAAVAGVVASDAPDGLERVSQDHGLAGQEAEHALADSPVAGYALPGAIGGAGGTALAGVLGVLATLAVARLASRSVRRRRPGGGAGTARPHPSSP